MSLGIRHRVWALAALVLGLFPLSAAASHFRYGALSWASTGNPGEVEFRLTASYERDAYPGSGPDGFPVTGDVFQEQQGPTSLAFDGAAGINGDFTQPLFFRVTAHSISEGWIVGQALDPVTGAVGVRHTYAGPGPFVAYLAGIGTGTPPVQFPGCCRIGQPGFPSTTDLANRAGLPYPLQTLVFPQSGNSSPVTTMVPIVVVPPSAAATFQIPALDPDGDSIQFRLSTDAEAGGPQHPPGLSVNAATGTVTWNNLTSGPGGTPLDQTKFWTTQIVIEDLDINGQVKTKTPVDFLLLIKPVTQNLPSCAISPAGPLTAPAGNPFSFLVTGTDVDPGDTVTLNTGGIPGGATLTPALPVTGSSPQSTQFAWTPTLADVGAHAVIFSATDTSGQQGLCQTTILVVDNASAPSCAISAHPSTVLAGTAVSFTVTGTDPGDTLTLDSSTVPAGATMTPPLPITNVPSPVTSQFNWTPGVGDVGSHPISFTVTDSANLVSTCNTTIQVVANASPPTCTINPPSQLNQPLTPTGGAGARIGGVLYASSAPGPRIGGVLYAPPTVQAGTPVSFTVTGTDLDLGDLLDLDLTSGALPTGAALTPPLPVTDVPSPVVTVLDWTPTVAQAGVHSFSFQVTDAAGQQGTCQTTVTVVVANNNPPKCKIDFLRGPGGPGDDDDDDNGDDEDDDGDRDRDRDRDRDGDRGRDADSVRLLASRGPDRGALRDGDGRDRDGRDSDDDDSGGGDDDEDDDGGNGGGVPAGTLVSFRVTGTDPDIGDILTLTGGPLPAGATMTPPLPVMGSSPVISEFQWTPNLSQVGPHVIGFTVTDTAGAQGFCEATVQVTSQPPSCSIEFENGGGGDDDGDNDDRDKDRDGDRDRDRDGDRENDGRSNADTLASGAASRSADRARDRDRDEGDGGRSVQVGTRVAFRVRATDPDLGDIITLTSGPLPFGATMTPPLPLSGTSPLRSRFLWTPNQDQLGSHVIRFTVTDLGGLQGSCQAKVKVTRRKPGCRNGGDDDRDKDRDGQDDRSISTGRDRDEEHDGNGDGDDEGCKPDDDDRDRDQGGDGDNNGSHDGDHDS